MKVPFNDLKRQTDSLGSAMAEAILRVATSGPYVMGPEVAGFENEFAAYCGVSHCVGLGNGTDALELAMRALGLQPGDRIAAVANAGFYAATAARSFGVEIVYVEIDPATRLIDLEDLARVLDETPIKAVVATHLYGLMIDMPALLKITDAKGIPVIEDCAQSHGAMLNGRKAGSFGAVAAFSFYPTKNLGAAGDGGAIATSDPTIADRVTRLRQYGWTSKYRVEFDGGRNSRLDPMQAAVLRLKLPRLDAWNEKRRQIAARYVDGIANNRVGLPPMTGKSYVAHLFVVTCDDRSGLKTHLEAAGIGTDVHYPIPDTKQPVVAGKAQRSLPVTESMAERVLTLPCFPEMTDAEIDCVIAAINSW